MGVMFWLWILGWLWCLSDLILKPRKLSYEKQFRSEIKKGRFDQNSYQNADKLPLKIRSDFGYSLSCELLRPNSEKEMEMSGTGVVILCHGLGCAKCVCIKYAEIYLKLGYTVLLYDHRNHGLSGKAYTSMGYFERYDLKKVVDWCFEHYGEDCKIITHGESMGAATVLMHLEIDSRVTCVVADCSYSDLIQLIKHQIKQFYHLPGFLIPVESLITYLRAGFWYRDISPLEVVRKTDIPILFIHGKIDNFVPTRMSKELYRAKSKNKAIYLVAGARHAESICKNRKGYEQVIQHFLNHAMKEA